MIWLWLACAGKPDPQDSSPPDETGTDTDTDTTDTEDVLGDTVTVTVTLDGAPIEGASVMQGGAEARWTTDADGVATIMLDHSVEGDLFVMASHPEARIWGDEPQSDTLSIALTRFDDGDNRLYTFQDPGEPERRDNTAMCAHCHVTMNADWIDTPHRTAASGTPLQDLYAGAAAAHETEGACADAGGQWWSGVVPGTTDTAERCYLGAGVLPLLNEGCGETGSCDTAATEAGDCADCHAPGIDGDQGGRNLLEATGFAYEYGVHCDVCHKVESVDLSQPPGVGGRLNMVRPSEADKGGLDDWEPLMFGPLDDVINPRMGSVHREHFQTASFCAGCHQHDQAVMVPDQGIDTDRWPDGTLPVHSTYAEWLAGPFADAAPCQSCHMPPDPDAGNAADLDLLPESVVGVAGGWWRPPGQVSRHTWTGPRSDVADMLGLAATVSVEALLDGETLQADVTVKNIGPGHALPTGEPMRAMLLAVTARCDGEGLDAIGGSAIPDFGGHRAMKTAGEDWAAWPGAEVGQRIQVVRRTGAYLDYTGFGPFGDGRFSAEEKGMPEEVVLGGAEIVAVDGDSVTLSAPLPDGDVAYRIDAADIPADGDAATPLAGLPGFGFARVLVGADGARMVPHFLAVDVASDNRLLPQQGWTSTHTFQATCEAPEVQATLLYRAYPLALAWERGWEMTERVMAEGHR